jgi:predicted secreted protein
MKPNLRKFALTAHITSSVGWLGAVVAYLALAIAGLISHDSQMIRAAYLSMELISWFVIVPFSLATLLAGLVESLGTPWGLFRHWWVLVKFLLTTVATIVLLQHMQAVTRMSGVAADETLSATDFRSLRIQLVVHAAGGLLVLLAATVLSVYKPWGMTPYGLRKQHERSRGTLAESPARPESDVKVLLGPANKTPRWVYVVGIHAIGLALLLLVIHLSGSSLRIH